MLHCKVTTTEEELGLFLKRASTQPSRYLILGVNKLPFKLQEVCMLYACACIHTGWCVGKRTGVCWLVGRW